MKNSQLTAEDFAKWKSSPVTQLFFDHMRAEREAMKEELATGTHTDASADGTAQKTADIIGRCTQLQELLATDAGTLGLEDEKEPTEEK